MKKQFSGFYSPSDEEIKNSWSDKNTLFVFDTNVLLNLYGYTEETREDFFKILEIISTNIWIPYHVGLEYQKNRLSVIRNEKKIFSSIEKYIESIEGKVNNSEFKNLKLKQRLPELFEKSEELHSKIDKLFSEYRESIKEWNDKQPDVRSTDIIRKKIDELFDEKVGNTFTEQKQLEEIFKEGEERYKNNVPPGYKDEKEKKDKPNFIYSGLRYIPMYGDLIIWKQIIEKSKEENIKSVIFVTDDVKEDWWYILDSNGTKEIGVRAELREEIYKESNISSFEILRTTDFMKSGKEFLELDIKEESIVEAKEIEDYKQRVKKVNTQRMNPHDEYRNLMEEMNKANLGVMNPLSNEYQNVIEKMNKANIGIVNPLDEYQNVIEKMNKANLGIVNPLDEYQNVIEKMNKANLGIVNPLDEYQYMMKKINKG